MTAPKSDCRRLFEGVPVGLYRSSPDGRILEANPALATMLGLPDVAALQATSVIELYVDAEDRRRWQEAVEREGTVRRFLFRLRRHDGVVIWAENTARSVRDAKGKVRFYLGSLEDVTSRVQAKEAHDRLVAILEATPDFVGIADRDQRPVYVNRAGRELLGIGPDGDLNDISLADCHPAWAASQLVEEALPQARRTGAWSGESAFRIPDGSVVPVSQVILAHKADDGSLAFFSTIARDISDRKRAEQTIRRQAEFSQSLIDSSVDGILAFDRECRFTIWNPALERASGYAEAEMLGRSAFEVFPFLRETRDDQLFQQALAGRTAVARDRPHVDRAGRRGYFEGHFSPLVDSGGAVVGGLAIIRDRTEHRMLEEQLRQSQKLEAVGRLAGGVAHDFSNMLTVIAGRAELLLLAIDRADPSYEHAEEILRSTEKAAALTRHMLAFSRRQVLPLRLLNLSGIVADLDRMLRRLIGEDVSVSFDLADDLAPVRADPSQMEQVVLNLVVNARDALPEGGRIVLRTSNVSVDENEARRHVDVTPGPHVLLEVEDDGVGIEPAALERIFDPFFTTKKRGTGLGLSTVYGIVRQSGGYVAVESRPGAGARFRVCFPRASEELAPVFEPAAIELRGGSETILVVEDEEHVLELTRLVLQRYGYRVLSASVPEEALRIADTFAGEIHVVLADVFLPGMTGREIVERLCQRRPGMRIAYMSGYGDDALVPLGPLGTAAFIEKPFSAESLAQTIREVLDGVPRRGQSSTPHPVPPHAGRGNPDGRSAVPTRRPSRS
jgi:PAS domain S-box-containing protein